MENKELASIVNGGDAFKVVEQGDWCIDLSTHHYDNHIVFNNEDLKFYRLDGYIRKYPTWLYDSSEANLVEVVPVERTTTHWKEV